MKNITYIDAHTHHIKNNDKNLSLYVLGLEENVPKDTPFCLGLHPWDTTKITLEEWIQNNELKLQILNCWAIGEIGLDNLKVANFENKLSYLEYFFFMAKKTNKPIILHLVKAFPEFIQFLKKNPSFQNIPMMIHAYQGKVEVTQELLSYPIYFSLGPRELSRNQPSDILKEYLYSRLLLETDDSKKNIEEVYQLAEIFFSKSILEIQNKVRENFQLLFPLSKSIFNKIGS
jgi:TatD DNase family protein